MHPWLNGESAQLIIGELAGSTPAGCKILIPFIVKSLKNTKLLKLLLFNKKTTSCFQTMKRTIQTSFGYI